MRLKALIKEKEEELCAKQTEMFITYKESEMNKQRVKYIKSGFKLKDNEALFQEEHVRIFYEF